MHFIPAVGRQRQPISEFEASTPAKAEIISKKLRKEEEGRKEIGFLTQIYLSLLPKCWD